MEQSFGLTFLYGLGVAIWLGFLFVVTLVIWKDHGRVVGGSKPVRMKDDDLEQSSTSRNG